VRSTPNPLPLSLRRAANRTAIPRKRAPDSLLVPARRGVLTRANTKAGSRGRQAVHRAEAERRQLARPLESARQALGHESAARREQIRISALVAGPDRYIELDGLTRRDRVRVARYNALVSNLAQGNISPAAFRRRVSRWQTIAGHRFLADPDAVLALMEQRRAADQETFTYERRVA
jgi:hypothetical protein